MIKKELSLRMGENVRQCRKDKGYTQEDLAEACNFSAAFCAQVETGSRMMSLPTLVKVSEVLHTTPNILIYGKTKNERIAPVSYTHLDVYKRQLFRCGYSVVGAYRLIETGEGPVDLF